MSQETKKVFRVEREKTSEEMKQPATFNAKVTIHYSGEENEHQHVKVELNTENTSGVEVITSVAEIVYGIASAPTDDPADQLEFVNKVNRKVKKKMVKGAIDGFLNDLEECINEAEKQMKKEQTKD